MCNSTCQLILSTIHSAKGQEYHTVYLLDAIDGVFPENIPAGGKPDIEMQKVFEEERRLYYVAVTRAKDNLHFFRFEPRAYFTDELVKRDSDSKAASSDGRKTQGSTPKAGSANGRKNQGFTPKRRLPGIKCYRQRKLHRQYEASQVAKSSAKGHHSGRV